jgi:hypothetical protein
LKSHKTAKTLAEAYCLLVRCQYPFHANPQRVVAARKEDAVYLPKKSANHILSKHNDIDTFELLLLPIAIDKGIYYREIDSDRFLNCVYRDENDKIYFVSMKVIENGHGYGYLQCID